MNIIKVELVQTVDLVLLQRLVELERDAFQTGGLNEWHLVPFIRHGRVYIARENQEVVGLAEYMKDWNNPHKAYLAGVSIARELRGRGKGTEFIRATLQTLKHENMEEIELTVALENEAAIKVYEKRLGFVRKEARENEYGPGEDRLVMTLSLQEFD